MKELGNILHVANLSNQNWWENLCSYVLGGVHLTNPALLVNRILKELTATEDTFYGWYLSFLNNESGDQKASIWLVWFWKDNTQPKISRDYGLVLAQVRWHMHLSGYVNTNYLLSLTEEEADEEQQKLYRLKHIIIL